MAENPASLQVSFITDLQAAILLKMHLRVINRSIIALRRTALWNELKLSTRNPKLVGFIAALLHTLEGYL